MVMVFQFSMSSIFQNAFRLSHKTFPEGGTCLEFGVHVGNSFVWQAEQVKKHFKNSTLIGFDSWEGLPEEQQGVWSPSRHAPGEYKSTKDIVLGRLRRIGMRDDARIRLVDGFFSDSLVPELQKEIKDLIFVNIDVDIYKSTIELLNFIKPLLRPGVVLYWDDWKDPKDQFVGGKWGEHLAWEEWSAKNKDVEAETIEVNPVNQRYMVVTKVGDKDLASAALSMKKIRYDAFELEQPGPAFLKKVVGLIKRNILKR